MEFTHIFRCLLVAVCVSTIVGETAAESNWLRRSLRSAKRERRTHKGNKISIDVIPGGVLSARKPKSRECCQNDGICIMNSFCHCKKRYYGRYCEHKIRHQSCGTVAHGTWMATGCHLCHCFDGKITCKVSTIPGCDSFPYVENRITEPDYQVDIDKMFEDYDKFYDGYEDDTDADAPSGVAAHRLPCYVLLGIVLMHTLIGNTGS